MTDRTLVLCPPRNAAYRDICLSDCRSRGEDPLALKVCGPDAVRLAERWIEAVHRLVVYVDLPLPDAALELVTEAEMAGVVVEERSIGTRPRRTVRERLAEMLA